MIRGECSFIIMEFTGKRKILIAKKINEALRNKEIAIG